jgi:hypothetical protein
VQGPAMFGGGAALPKRASVAAEAEAGAALGGDGHGASAGTGRDAGVVVDDEVVAVEPAGDRSSQRDRFDRSPVAGPAERHTCGRERTQSEWEQLFSVNGFRIESQTQLPLLIWVFTLAPC